jgi:hypothetical protein
VHCLLQKLGFPDAPSPIEQRDRLVPGIQHVPNAGQFLFSSDKVHKGTSVRSAI